MATQEPESLESLLNKATNPSHTQEDWEAIMAFCDQINKELEGPQISVRLLAHKIQSPQQNESMYALETLNTCVKNCGKRFHQEIGKFRFLNEIIKVISPKYLGNHMSESVKKRCIELLYGWSQGLKHEPKIEEAYQMLKRQGIVKKDPVHVDKTYEPPPSPSKKNSVFEDDDKSKLLARLLKSKNPEDLQAANRLIKNMVKQDMERMEKASKRIQELETVTNNIQLLSDMLNHYEADSATSSELDVMKELYDNIEKRRPNLFRLASDTGEAEADAMSEILKVNDDVVRVMTQYKKIVEGKTEENGLDTLYDPKPRAEIVGPRFGDTDISTKPAPTAGAKDLDDLRDLFSSVATDDNTPDSGLLSGIDGPADASAPGLMDMTSTVSQQPFYSLMQTPLVPATAAMASPTHSVFAAAATDATAQPLSTASAGPPAYSFAAPPQVSGGVGMGSGSLTGAPVTGILGTAAAPSPVRQNSTGQAIGGSGLEDLAALGQSLMQQSLASTGKQSAVPTVNKVPMNQLSRPAIQPTQQQQQAVAPSPALPTPTPPSVTPAPALPPSPPAAEPLTDVFVPLETIQPGTIPPLNPFDKHSVKVMMIVGKDRPRPDVMVVIISVISTNTASPVKAFSFQAAVPKSMKIKLQPSSGVDLPVFNPILPPSAITQVMLIANPKKEKFPLKYKLTFNLDNEEISDIGEIEDLPVQ